MFSFNKEEQKRRIRRTSVPPLLLLLREVIKKQLAVWFQRLFWRLLAGGRASYRRPLPAELALAAADQTRAEG